LNSRSTSSLIVFAQPRYVALQCVTFCAVRNGLCSFSVTIARCIAFSSCFFSADVRRIIVFLLLCGLFFLFSSSIRQQIERVRQLQQQIGPGRGHVARAPQRRFRPVDVYAQLCEQGDPSFRIATRFTRSQFDDLVVELRPLIMANRHIRTNVPEPTGHLRSAKQTVENRLLMAIKFLVHGSSVGDLAIQFGVSKSAVSEELRHVIFALVSGLAYEIAWPTLEQQQRLKGLLGPRFANAIGTLDGTYTQTWRRHGDFSGHRWMYLRTSQVTADCLGYVIHVLSGLVGSRHDSWNYRLSDVAGRLAADDADLLVDSAYLGLPHLVPPATASSLPDAAARAEFNIEHTSRRSRIESFIGRIKALFKLLARRWERADRKLLAVCFVAGCILYNRFKRLNE
jgi:hypothetical protein